MINNEEVFAKFFESITGSRVFGDFFVEVVMDYTRSVYFPSDRLSDIYDVVMGASKAGQEVHFGPAVRKEDLGSKRSDRNNLFYSKCLWMDIDSPEKDVSGEEKLKRSKQLLDEFLEALKSYNLEPSFIICSGHGYHVYFILQKVYLLPSETWEKMQGALINLAKADPQAKDTARLLRVPLTSNFKNRENPRPVEFVAASGRVWEEKDFGQLVKDHAPKKSQVEVTQEESKPLGFIPPCIEHLLNPTTLVPLGHRHTTRLVLGTFGFHEGWTEDDMVQKVAHFTEDPKKSEEDIRGVYKALQSDPTKYNVGCDEGSLLKGLVDAKITVCDKNQCQFTQPQAKVEEPKPELTANFEGLVDLVVDDQGKLAFLVKENGNLIIKDRKVTLQGVLVPPPREAIIWTLPRGSEVIRHFPSDTDAALFRDLIEYHSQISELPTEDHYKFLAAWDMHTYLLEKFEHSPIPWFFGLTQRGKTRTGKGMIYVSYRGVHTMTIREQHIIRLAQDLKATIFFDLMDIWKRAVAAGAEDILLFRFEKGGKVPRVLYPERGKFQDTVYYDVYGATIIATNEPVDEIMETRTIQMVMKESNRRFQSPVRPENGLPFRERLCAFRARWMDQVLPDVSYPVGGRLGEMVTPIRQIVHIVGQGENWFLEFVKAVEADRKKAGADSFDAQVVVAIKESLGTISHGHLLHEHILANLNRGKSAKEEITAQKLGRATLRLGFEKFTDGQHRGIVWNQDNFHRLCERFGIEIEGWL